MENISLIIALINLVTEILKIIRKYISKNKRAPRPGLISDLGLHSDTFL